ncbi:hypothetical protein BX666DRAFT_1978024 [Dichotomocladium elegans]|nr:hypothetical protein BX666DRAFT_1978024 [Dichotomocladium elegans]
MMCWLISLTVEHAVFWRVILNMRIKMRAGWDFFLMQYRCGSFFYCEKLCSYSSAIGLIWSSGYSRTLNDLAGEENLLWLASCFFFAGMLTICP